MPKMITVLEDCVRYRDGKKWKKRHCFLSKPDTKRRTVKMFITKQFGSNVPIHDVEEKSLRQYVVDEITGFEHGRHVDKESHVMALIGCNIVYCIAFEHPETMFRWAETLNKLLTNDNFHVTLKRVSETSGLFNKISTGTQGNLHVQQSRLCLIGEPADGNKFIYEWSIANLISVLIDDTTCDKIKKLQIKSNGKVHKGKGHFEFEIGLTQTSVFENTFRTFLTACKHANPEFQTNFPLKPDSSEINIDKSCSYSIACCDKKGINPDNSGSLEKRSSEIPIPRSREHSGPDQRPIENCQIKMRKSHKNLQTVMNELHKHYSVIETAKHDHDVCLFADDEEIEEQVRHKSQNLFCRGLSQESSGVYVNGPADSMRDRDLSVRLSVQNDSGCGIFPCNPLQSTSSTRHDIDHNVLPPCRKTPSHRKTDVFLNFYRNVYRNPLSLNNYTNYYRLLRTISDKRSQLLKRSNSFNCVHLPDMKKFEYCRKYSHTHFPLKVAKKVSEQHLKAWKETFSGESIEDTFLCMNFDRDRHDDVSDSSRVFLSKRLPFRSMEDFHCSMMGSLQSGTVCFNLFSYHHFLSLLKDVKSVFKNIDSKGTTFGNDVEYRILKDKLSRKNKTHNHWLERIHSYSNGPWDPEITELSILDINIMLVFEIIDSIVHMSSTTNRTFCDIIPRHKSYFDTNPTIELNDDKFLLAGDNEDHVSPALSADSTIYRDVRPVLCMSCSTPNFRDYPQHERVHKLSNTETRYQNLSSNDTFDTMNHTFPKYNTSLNTSYSSDNKEGSFKRFRRKYSPHVLIPFIKRKTTSINSTLSEPICRNDSKELNSYYNIANHRDIYNKKSLSVVLDCGPYVNVKPDSKYINVSKNPETTTLCNDSFNYLNTCNPSIYDDDTPYPEEIIDPSRNYGDLNFIQSRMRHTTTTSNTDNHSNWLNFRRSSLSILSQKSLQNFGTCRSVSFNKRGCSNISRVHSDACNNTSNFRSTDYINVKTLRSSPQSRTLPQSLNYVTVMGQSSNRDNSSHKFPNTPLTIYTEYDPLTLHNQDNHDNDDDEPSNISSYHNNNNNYRRTWHTPQSSPVVDYCQIDLNCTYVLRDIDRMLYDKKKFRDTLSLKNISPDDIDSVKSIDPIMLADNYSLSSGSGLKDKKSSHKYSKKSFCRLFSRKC